MRALHAFSVVYHMSVPYFSVCDGLSAVWAHTWDAALPLEQVHRVIRCRFRLGQKPKRVVLRGTKGTPPGWR